MKVKVGQVYKSKDSGLLRFVVIAVSKDGKKVVNGIEWDPVDPVWDTDYLLKTCDLDERF